MIHIWLPSLLKWQSDRFMYIQILSIWHCHSDSTCNYYLSKFSFNVEHNGRCECHLKWLLFRQSVFNGNSEGWVREIGITFSENLYIFTSTSMVTVFHKENHNFKEITTRNKTFTTPFLWHINLSKPHVILSPAYQNPFSLDLKECSLLIPISRQNVPSFITEDTLCSQI